MHAAAKKIQKQKRNVCRRSYVLCRSIPSATGVLLEHLRNEGFEVTQATVSRDIRELCLVKAATTEGYRYVSSRNESFNPKTQGRFETIFHESVLGVDYAGHVVLVKCYSGMANAACEVFDALQWKNVVGTLSGDDTFLIVARSERDAKTICSELTRYVGRDDGRRTKPC